jgi:hypothetical protein
MGPWRLIIKYAVPADPYAQQSRCALSNLPQLRINDVIRWRKHYVGVWPNGSCGYRDGHECLWQIPDTRVKRGYQPVNNWGQYVVRAALTIGREATATV